MLKYFPAGSMSKIFCMLAFAEIKIKIIVFRRYSENVAAPFRIVICHLEDRRGPTGPALIFFYLDEWIVACGVNHIIMRRRG